MQRFTQEPLWEIYQYLRSQYSQLKARDTIAIEVVDPDIHSGSCNGETKQIGDLQYLYRCHKSWVDLGELLNCRYLTPKHSDTPFIQIRYEILDLTQSWHSQTLSDDKYGANSEFSRVHKLEEPCFVVEYVEALSDFAIPQNSRILNLGINKGDEFSIFSQTYSEDFLQTLEFVGIDISESAIQYARNHLPNSNYQFIAADIRDWGSWDIGQFDGIISIGTLHSPSLDGKNILAPLLKKLLKPTGFLLLGFPNSRYIDGEIIFGSKTKNYQKPEWSLLLKDIAYYRRLLYRQGFQVKVIGKYYLFICARKVE